MRRLSDELSLKCFSAKISPFASTSTLPRRDMLSHKDFLSVMALIVYAKVL